MGPAVIESALWHGSWRSTPSVTTASDFMLHWSSQTACAWQLILMFLDLGRNLFNDDNTQFDCSIMESSTNLIHLRLHSNSNNFTDSIDHDCHLYTTDNLAS